MSGKRVPRWPLTVIGAPAAVAVWSGWVGLGQLCGFGLVHPLPGIWDSAHLNTSITLPIGVEAYGAYAMGAWLTPGTSPRARRFAMWSALGSLTLGMLGQVIYHLLAAEHATRAPWPVTVLVSCLPVVALALGTALAHLLHEPSETMPVAVAIPTHDAMSEAVSEPVPTNVPEIVPEVQAVPVPASVPPIAPAAETVAPGAPPRQPGIGMTLEEAAREFEAEIRAGALPSLRAIRTRCHTGAPRAQAILDHLTLVSREQSGVLATAPGWTLDRSRDSVAA